jgi:RNA-directed DNA polymerase
MRLTINRQKTRVVDLRVPGASVDFLGYTFRFDRDRYRRKQRYLNMVPSAKAMTRERRRLVEMTGASVCFKPLPQLIGDLNEQLRGWAAYFGEGYPRKAFREINRFARLRLVRHLRRRSQRPWRAPHGVTAYAHFARLGLLYL